MAKMKKVLMLALVFVLTAALTLGGTVAYLQDEDSDVNVMTLGNVKIEQHEYERVVDADGTYKTDTIDNQTSYVLKDFTQAKPLLPTTDPTNHGAGRWDDTTVRMSQVDSYGGMQVFVNPNAQDKFVTVENTGKSDAYVRTIVAIEVGSTDGKLIGTSYHSNWTQNAIGKVEIDGNYYNVFEYVYRGASDNSRHVNGVLPAGDTSYPNLSQVYIASKATNEDMEKIDGNGNGKLDILVLSQAVQAQGFASASDALTAGFGDVTAEKVAEWFGGEEFKMVEVSNSAELADAVAAGNTNIWLNAGEYDVANCGGKTLTINGTKDAIVNVVGGGQGEANGQLDYGFDGSNVTFNGITIKTNNQTYAGYARLTANYNNCVFENYYCLNGDSVFNYCTFNVSGDQYNIWTWGAPTATFNNCTFNSDGKALLLYGTKDTKLTVNNCTFNDKGGLTDKKAAIEIGNDYDKSYELIVNNTTVNGYDDNPNGIDTATTLWANKNSMGTDKLNVVIDGDDVY